MTHLAVRELSGGDPWRIRSGITTVSSRRAGTAASSSLEAQELDEVQYGLGEGSCLTAARDRALVLVPDLRVEPRWPRHVGHMVSRDIGPVLAVPFELQDGDRAALKLYSRDVHRPTPDESIPRRDTRTKRPARWHCRSRSPGTKRKPHSYWKR